MTARVELMIWKPTAFAVWVAAGRDARVDERLGESADDERVGLVAGSAPGA